MEFFYRDRVKIINGFYINCVGVITDYKKHIYNNDGFYVETKYYVEEDEEMARDRGRNPFSAWIKAENLWKI